VIVPWAITVMLRLTGFRVARWRYTWWCHRGVVRSLRLGIRKWFVIKFSLVRLVVLSFGSRNLVEVRLGIRKLLIWLGIHKLPMV